MITKVKAINDKHGPFEALLCLGDVLRPYDSNEAELSQEEQDLLSGVIKCKSTYQALDESHTQASRCSAPVPLYFFQSSSLLHPQARSLVKEHWKGLKDGHPVQMAPHLFFCGKAEVIRLPNGLRIALAGGNWDASKWSDSTGKEIDEVEVRRI